MNVEISVLIVACAVERLYVPSVGMGTTPRRAEPACSTRLVPHPRTSRPQPRIAKSAAALELISQLDRTFIRQLIHTVVADVTLQA